MEAVAEHHKPPDLLLLAAPTVSLTAEMPEPFRSQENIVVEKRAVNHGLFGVYPVRGLFSLAVRPVVHCLVREAICMPPAQS